MRSLVFFTIGKEHHFQTERRFAFVEEVGKGSVPVNSLCKPPPPKNHIFFEH